MKYNALAIRDDKRGFWWAKIEIQSQVKIEISFSPPREKPNN